MLSLIFNGFFLICLLVYLFGIFRQGVKKTKKIKVKDSRIDIPETIFSIMAFIGMQALPVIYIFTSWMDFADYGLSWISSLLAGLAGAILFLFSLIIVRQSHIDLGINWSPTLEIKEGQRLVTGGIYERIRHPIYLSQWIWCIAQALLLQNWIAGFAGLVSFIPVYLYRVPKEEKMMLDNFGEEYRTYMERTGRIIPRQK
jgi:protein-S-isoprenylcysteine O-methyltransferase Ste14